MASGNVGKNPQYIVRQYTDENSVVNDIEPSSADDAAFLLEFNVGASKSYSLPDNSRTRIKVTDFYANNYLLDLEDKSFYKRQPPYLHYAVISSFNCSVGANRHCTINYLVPIRQEGFTSSNYAICVENWTTSTTQTARIKSTLIPPYLVDYQTE